MDEKKVFGQFTCAGCGYRNSDPHVIQKHIMEHHPNLKESIRERYREMAQL